MKLLPLYRDTKDEFTKKLIDQCLKGSEWGRKGLFDLYYSDGMNIALRYSSNGEDAQEILSNAFIRAFKKIGTFDKSKSFMPWFKKIIVHASSDYYRYQNQAIVSLDKLPEPHFDAHILDYLSYQELLKLVQQLPAVHRAVFNLYLIEGYKHREIAKLLQISEGTSKSYLSRAKCKLKQMILEFSKLQAGEPVRREDKKKVSPGS